MLANMMRVLRYVFVIHACEGDDAVTRCDRRNSSVVRRDVRACGADVVVWTSSRACEWRATSRARAASAPSTTAQSRMYVPRGSRPLVYDPYVREIYDIHI